MRLRPSRPPRETASGSRQSISIMSPADRKFPRRRLLSDAQSEIVVELECRNVQIRAAHCLVLIRELPNGAAGIVPFTETARIVEPALPQPFGCVPRCSNGCMDDRTSTRRAQSGEYEERWPAIGDGALAPCVRCLGTQVIEHFVRGAHDHEGA